MLSLSKQIDRHKVGSAPSSAITEYFGWPGQQIDTGDAEELPLRFGDKGVARAGDNVGRAHADAAVGHGRHGLHATDAEDLVRAGGVQSIECRGKNAGRVYAADAQPVTC